MNFPNLFGECGNELLFWLDSQPLTSFHNPGFYVAGPDKLLISGNSQDMDGENLVMIMPIVLIKLEIPFVFLSSQENSYVFCLLHKVSVHFEKCPKEVP